MKKSKLIAAVLAAAMTLTTLSAAFPASAVADPSSGAVVSAFQNPNYQQKPMARMWFPDAGAGIDEYDTIEKQIMALADGGFGGVEVTMMVNGSNMNNEDAKLVGWGTPAYQSLLKKVLRAAEKVEGGFIVDITITAHWPTVINNVDPNDAAASQELSYQYKKVTAEDIGTITSLPLPEQKISRKNDGLPTMYFLYTDTFVSAALAKVVDMKEVTSGGGGGGWPGGGEFPGGQPMAADAETTYTPVFEFDSVIDLTDSTSVIEGAGYAAGVPDEAAWNEYYAGVGSYQENIVDVYGEETTEEACADSFNGKIDSEGNRLRMADWQNFYQTDLTGVDALEDYTPSEGEELQVGDYVLVGLYRRGTGQVMSDGPFGGTSNPMAGSAFVTNYFCSDGVDAITTYWNENLLDDELVELLKQNGSSIFEDSIEASFSSSAWSYNLIDEMEQDGYQYTTELPLVKALGASSFDDSAITAEIGQDYNLLMGRMYEQKHAAPIMEWAKGFNYTYRAQPYSLAGLDVGSASAAIDIPEGDNGAKGDGLRYMASAVNMGDKQYFSMEAVTATGNLRMNWADIATEVAQNYSDGVNHAILHGTPYSKNYNGFDANWPGWMAFGNCFAGSYTYRQTYWDDVNDLADFMARNQAVLQEGTAKVDLVFLKDKTTTFSTNKGNDFQTLLNSGYSYNMLSEGLFNLENAKVTGGVLCENGPAYKALIFDQVSTISTQAMASVLEYAQAGLPVILYKSNPSNIYGSDSETNSDAAMLALYDELLTLSNVKSASSEEELLAALEELGVTSYASYDLPYLETSHYVDEEDGSNFYYIFNNPASCVSNTGMSAGKNLSFKNGDAIEGSITLTGEGIPYTLDAWTGEVTPIGNYIDNGDGTITTNVSLTGGSSTIIGILKNTDGLTQPTQGSAVSADGGQVVYQDGELVFRSNEAGNHQVELADGSSKTVYVPSSLETVDLSDEGWTLVLESWGPDTSEENIQGSAQSDGISGQFEHVIYKDPSNSTKTSITFENVALGTWSELQPTDEQLETIGMSVETIREKLIAQGHSNKTENINPMDYVSGIGLYTKTFTLPEGWTSSTGAVMNLTYSQDQITKVIVNGHEITTVDNISDQLDIGKYLVAGENTISVKLASPLANRAIIESFALASGSVNGQNMQMSGNKPETIGLTSVTLTPYTQIALNAPNTSILDQVIAYADQAIASGELDGAIGSVQDSFLAAYENAVAVAENPASQAQVDEAWITLMNEIHKLGFQAGDKEALSKLVNYASSLDMSLYTDGLAKDTFLAALAAAEEVLSDRDALQEDVETAQDSLLDALANLRYKADKSILEQLLTQANAIDTSAYTAETVDAFHAAKAASQEVYQNPEAEQDEVDQAVSNLSDAINALEILEPVSTAPVAGDSTAATGSSTPKTGEATPIALAAALLLLSGCAIFKKRRH